MPASAAQFKAAAFLLLTRFGALDSKSMLPAVRRIAASRDGGGVEPAERLLVSSCAEELNLSCFYTT